MAHLTKRLATGRLTAMCRAIEGEKK